MLLLVAAATGDVYLADRMVLTPGRALQRQMAERDAQIREFTERNQAFEAAVRLLRHTERRARLVVLDQAPGPEGHVRTRASGLPSLDAQGNPVGEPRELVLDGDEVYVDALVLKFEDTFGPRTETCWIERREMPQSYAAERAPTAFERELWARFSRSWPTIPRRLASAGSEPSTARPSRHGSERTASTPSRCVRRVS